MYGLCLEFGTWDSESLISDESLRVSQSLSLMSDESEFESDEWHGTETGTG